MNMKLAVGQESRIEINEIKLTPNYNVNSNKTTLLFFRRQLINSWGSL